MLVHLSQNLPGLSPVKELANGWPFNESAFAPRRTLMSVVKETSVTEVEFDQSGSWKPVESKSACLRVFCLPVREARPLNMATIPDHLGWWHHRQKEGEVWVASSPDLNRSFGF